MKYYIVPSSLLSRWESGLKSGGVSLVDVLHVEIEPGKKSLVYLS